MRTMAGVWLSVLVLITLNNGVFGVNDVCNTKNPANMTCDECFRCNYEWCNLINIDVHCVAQPTVDWCANNRESKILVPEVIKQGDIITPSSITRTLNLGAYDRVLLNLNIDSASPGKLSHEFPLTHPDLQQFIKVKINNWHQVTKGGKWISAIETMVLPDFCVHATKESSHVTIQSYMDTSEQVMVKLDYYVLCTCGCTDNWVQNSDLCNNHGNYICGVCECTDGWTGKNCSEKICPPRGDIDQCNANTTCYGNGKCDTCDNCVCFTDDEYSSQLLDEYCADPCMSLQHCDYDCFRDESCSEPDCPTRNVTLYNETQLSQTDEDGKKMWKFCTLKFMNNVVEYYGMRYDSVYTMTNYLEIMIVNTDFIGGGQGTEINGGGVVGGSTGTAGNNSTNTTVAGAGSLGTGTTDKNGGNNLVPIILGTLAALALASAAGYMVYRHMTSLPPAPTKESQYTNIDAEDATCENPLYKPPTSIFKNPMYGK